MKGIDIREHGSGNIGVANTFRVLGKKHALLVLIGDCMKGYLCIQCLKMISATDPCLFYLVGLATIIGHNWSIFLRFKGGKGIATTYGVVLALYPYLALLSAALWFIIVMMTKYAALGSILSVLFMFILSFLFKTSIEFKYFIFILFLFAITRHRMNIIRLIQSKENKIIK